MAVGVPKSLSAWLPRILLLLAIWGTAIFLWGTFGAWTYDQYAANERRIAEAHVQPVADWLTHITEPLDVLAADERLALGMELPAGVESLPVQRVLYEYSYLTRQTEVYIVDLLRKRVGKTAGASPLPVEVIERLADLPASERMVLGMGSRNGQMMVIRRVKAPLPERLVVMVPISLGTLAGSYPTATLPANRALGLVVPHASGWAEWQGDNQGFTLDAPLAAAIDAHVNRFEVSPWIQLLIPVPHWNGVMLDLQTSGAVSGARILPQLLVALWALVMSLLVLWNSSQIYRDKARNTLAPVLAPLDKAMVPLQGIIHSLSDAISARWNSSSKDIPLVNGPGAFDKDDFASADEQLARSALLRKTKNFVRPLKLTQEAPDVAEKLPIAHGERAAQTERPKMAWPQTSGTGAKPSIKLENDKHTDDDENMLEIVKECLRKRSITLLYQAIYRAHDNIPTTHEVYARLVRPNGEMIQPDVFMPIILRHRLALDLDLAVLRKVVNENFVGGKSPLTPLALNISSTSLDGIAYLQEMAAQGPRVLQKINFEVRSQEMIRDPKALRLLKDLQKHGGSLAVDYFGGGKAMLDASLAMGFNFVKLNCRKVMESQASQDEAMAMCAHARSIGLPIILEMIGDADALAFARRCGVDYLQGFELSLPAKELTNSPLT